MFHDFHQTWWNNQIKEHFEEFKSWIGDSSAISKKWARQLVIENKYESVVDIGCGTATEYFAYKKDAPSIKYLGVDGSNFLYEKNIMADVPMILAQADSIPIDDSSYDVAFSRHVFEHQPDFRPCLKEMIRVGKKLAIHVFFIKPKDNEIINWDNNNNLYHNTFVKNEIESFAKEIVKVKSVSWIDITNTEEALIIEL